MSGNCFLDTNILIYFLSKDEIEKQKICQTLLQTKSCIISTQVLNEISNVLLKKFKLEHESVLHVISDLNSHLEVAPISFATITLALRFSKKYKISYYDSLILSSAYENNCSLVYSEDMQDGFVIEKKLKIKNPFAL